MEEKSIDVMDFYDNPNILLDTVLEHQRQSGCTSCQWTVAIVDQTHLTLAQTNNYDCLLFIDIELEVVGKFPNRLVTEYGFYSDDSFKITPNNYHTAMGLIIYCNQLPQS